MLNMRLAAPGAPGRHQPARRAGHVRPSPSGVRVGALARHAGSSATQAPTRVQPLLRQALRLGRAPGDPQPGHHGRQPRARRPGRRDDRGAGADRRHRDSWPAPAAGATVPAADFFLGPLESGLRAGRAGGRRRTSRRFPAGPAPTFVEVARRHGDYAVCGVGAAVTAGRRPPSRRPRAAYVSVGSDAAGLDLTAAVAGARGRRGRLGRGRRPGARADRPGGRHPRHRRRTGGTWPAC